MKTKISKYGRTARRDVTVRSRVAAAFQNLAHGVTQAVAYASTVRFYRSTGQAWTKALA